MMVELLKTTNTPINIRIVEIEMPIIERIPEYPACTDLFNPITPIIMPTIVNIDRQILSIPNV